MGVLIQHASLLLYTPAAATSLVPPSSSMMMRLQSRMSRYIRLGVVGTSASKEGQQGDGMIRQVSSLARCLRQVERMCCWFAGQMMTLGSVLVIGVCWGALKKQRGALLAARRAPGSGRIARASRLGSPSLSLPMDATAPITWLRTHARTACKQPATQHSGPRWLPGQQPRSGGNHTASKPAPTGAAPRRTVQDGSPFLRGRAPTTYTVHPPPLRRLGDRVSLAPRSP